MVRNANFGLNLVVFEQKIWVFFIKMDPVFFIKSAKNGSFFINMNIWIKWRIYTPASRQNGILALCICRNTSISSPFDCHIWGAPPPSLHNVVTTNSINFYHRPLLRQHSLWMRQKRSCQTKSNDTCFWKLQHKMKTILRLELSKCWFKISRAPPSISFQILRIHFLPPTLHR